MRVGIQIATRAGAGRAAVPAPARSEKPSSLRHPVATCSNLRLPIAAIFADPEFLGLLIAQDLAGLTVEVDLVAGSVSDVAQVTEQGAFEALLDLGVKRFGLPYGVDEIAQVHP